MRLLLLAPPGGGKGTQGIRLAEHFGIRHIAAGDLLRDEMGAATRVGRLATGYVQRGELVPDQVVFDLVMPLVTEAAARGGYVLDGFPRDLAQAQAFEESAGREGVGLDAAVYLPTDTEELVRRLLLRAGESGRSDDTPEVIRHRLVLYAEETEPLVAYYRERGILVTVDGGRAVGEVFGDILAGLGELSAGSAAR